MIDPTFHRVELPADLEEAGFAYGRRCAELLGRPRREAYVGAMMAINRTTPEHLAERAAAWAARLPERYQRQMAAMAAGAGLGGAAGEAAVREWLYVDIAAPAPGCIEGGAAGEPAEARLLRAGEGACSGVVAPIAGEHWVGRNCDWYEATLMRGTCAVFHRAPHRIPCVAMGLMGDIDADTGMNAEQLWLHMHTLLARDEPRAGVSCISWLFWMREALETCATLADVERLLGATDRDRGVMLFAVDGKTGERAVYECTKASYRRVDPDGRGHLAATNHCRAKHPPTSIERVARAGSTVTRMSRLLELLEHAAPEHGPDDVCELLADEWVEMRETTMSRHLRTIYSAVACPERGEVWFASGATPAASRGVWRRVEMAW